MRSNGQYVDFKDLSTKRAINHIRKKFGYDLVLMMMLDDYVRDCAISDKLDSELESGYGERNDVKLLSSIPGIGVPTAVELCSMIVDIDRFISADKMRSYFGMAPKVRDSGSSVKHGHITRAGDKMMRCILSRVVGSMIRWAPNDSVPRYKNSHVGRMGKGKSNVASMNKLLDIIFAILKRGTPYKSM